MIAHRRLVALGGKVPRIDRPIELMLLVVAALATLVAFAQLALTQPGVGPRDVAFLAAVFTSGLVVHAVLGVRVPTADQLVLPIAALLAGLGLVFVARLAPSLLGRQSLWIGLGFGLVAAIAWRLRSVDVLRNYRYIAATAGLVLVGLTVVFGVDPNGSGARLWLGLGSVTFQPSELLKILLVVFFAAYLDEYGELIRFAGPRVGPVQLPPLPYLLPLLTMLAVSMMILTLQRDLGAAVLFFTVFMAMLHMASGRLGYTVVGCAVFLGAGAISYHLFPHVRPRFDSWIDPWAAPATTGYQTIQALYALAAGGLSGAGLGSGYPEYVPAVHTDLVIAAIGEEMGLVGTLAVVALYALVTSRGFRVATTAQDPFTALLAAGCSCILGLQALVILGGTLRLLPLTGITLPFISYGGSSMLANFLIVGLLLVASGGQRLSVDERVD